MTLRLVTVNGQPSKLPAAARSPRQYARLVDCDGPLFAAYQHAKKAWDNARIADDPDRETKRRAAIMAYDAWAVSCGMAPIASPKIWGFN
jgi:hypothetical protein